jgi:hypothetical protein
MNTVSNIRSLIDLVSQHELTSLDNTPIISIKAQSDNKDETIKRLIDYINELEQEQSGTIDDEDDHDPRDIPSPADDDERFLPPLQLSIELQKKLAGVQPKNTEEDSEDGHSPFLDAKTRKLVSHIYGDDPSS